MFLKNYLWSILVVSLLLLNVPVNAASIDSKVNVSYRPHIEDIGWTEEVKNGEVAGTTGQNKAIQAIEIQADLSSGSSIEYQSHLSGIGWEENWASAGGMSGTTGENRPIEAIKIRLTGEDAQIYDIYYRTHISDVGWLDWACNGQDAGSTGLCRKLQAIQIVILDKGSPAPGDTQRAFVCKGMTPINQAQTHVSNIGWSATRS